MEELDGICLLSDSGEVFARGLRVGEGQRKCGLWIVGAIGAQRSLCDRAFRLGVYLGSLSLGLCTLEPPHVGREQIGLQFRKSTAGCCEEFGRGAASGPCLRQPAVADIVVAVRFNQEAQLSAEVTDGAVVGHSMGAIGAILADAADGRPDAARALPVRVPLDACVRLPRAVPVDALPGFAEGWFSVQDAGAQLAAPLLDVHDGQRVLDACLASARNGSAETKV
jgi:hypothetical protein